MPITITSRGSWDNTSAYLQRLSRRDIFATLERYGALGVDALSKATPIDSGATAKAWMYEIVQREGYYSIRWFNTNNVNGRPIAILLQYGHGTRNGGYIQGRDYIMPAIRPIFDQIDAELGRVVRGNGNR